MEDGEHGHRYGPCGRIGLHAPKDLPAVHPRHHDIQEDQVGPLGLAAALAGSDAAVRIGDKALFEVPPERLIYEDLGSTWDDLTGLPFVFAVWAAREGVLDRELYEILHASKREGLEILDLIAEDYTYEGRQHPDRSRAYLRDCIRYRLGQPEVEGLEAFLRRAERHGLIERAPAIPLASFGKTGCDELAETLRRAL